MAELLKYLLMCYMNDDWMRLQNSEVWLENESIISLILNCAFDNRQRFKSTWWYVGFYSKTWNFDHTICFDIEKAQFWLQTLLFIAPYSNLLKQRSFEFYSSLHNLIPNLILLICEALFPSKLFLISERSQKTKTNWYSKTSP